MAASAPFLLDPNAAAITLQPPEQSGRTMKRGSGEAKWRINLMT